MEKLAIEGGKPVNTEPFPPWPSFSEKTFKMIIEPLKTSKLNYWTGEYGKKFEKELAKWHKAKYCVSTVNEYGAFHLALVSLGIDAGDEVICPSYTYFPPIFAILNTGALPVFADTDYTHTLDPKDIENKITERTKAIIVVHLYGVVADMEPVIQIAKKYNLYVIEDCTECFGGIYKGKKTGTIGDIGCFNLCHTKHLVTGGEGGAIITNNEKIYLDCFSMRDYGFDTSKGLDMLKMEKEYLYIHNKIGFNYRPTEIQAIIGLCELERMDSWNLHRRRKNAEFLIESLKDHPLILYVPYDSEERKNSFWWAPFVIKIEKLKVPLKQFILAMEAEGVPVYGSLWPELYKEKVLLEKTGRGKVNLLSDPRKGSIDYSKVECKTAKWLSERTISFFTHPVYEISHMERYIEAFNKVAKFYLK
ncbi:MAG: DegT/DnrJ/EryC1/StrS family aminotransferase [Deltaproteobacteria bacterium]|nr:MAG: DegT/DnrJ/EryC1/StrS family aminotransferase [Deltaproteobacteria bacterium]